MRYAERLQQRIEKSGSRLCVGLDPRPGDGGASAAYDFLKQVIEETADQAAAFKPNMAYFEAMGIKGIQVLEDLLAERAPSPVAVGALTAEASPAALPEGGSLPADHATSMTRSWTAPASSTQPFTI